MKEIYRKNKATLNISREISYIFAPDGLTAIYETKNGVNKMYFTSSDHLGSINLIVDGSNGNVVDDLSYDAWGRNRNPVDWTYSNFTLSSVTDRGYTSHEQLPSFGLINMNVPIKREQSQACLNYAEREAHRGEASTYGRIYDPMTLGFLSPDPFVQNPSNSQNFNRFSYVLNNPLKYVDPSGYVALNPWYEYQAGPKTKFYTWMPEFYEEYLDNQGRNWKYYGETINTPGFYGDETGMWISKLNEHNELIYNYNELRQIVQNNANSNSFFSSFSMGAGTFRVEGEGNGINVFENNGVIKEFKPNVFERFSESNIGKSVVGKVIYGVADDLYLTLTSFIYGAPYASHLSGSGAISNETVMAGLNTFTNFTPISSFSKTLKIGDNVVNAGLFNKIFSGTKITAATNSGREIRLYNHVIRENNDFIRLMKFYGFFSYPINYN